MPRWESGSRERLAESALRLFERQGFEGTTVAEIAAEAGLTERTFFRYYGDKREVLFAGQEDFEAVFLDALDSPASSGPMDLVAAALAGAATLFPDQRRPWSRLRQKVIDANPGLAERESHKMAGVSAALTAALIERAIEPDVAALAAEAGVSVFRRTFTTWVAQGETRGFAEILDHMLARFRGLLDHSSPAPR